MSARCKSCGAAIIWAETPKGKRIPIDITPTALGNLVLRRDVPDGPIIATPTSGDEVPTHVSHFATCPDAPAHRRTK